MPKELLAAGLDEMRRTIREQEPERPSTRVSTLANDKLSTTAQRRGLDAPKLVSELRGDLDWIVMKALEKDRARRYETANGLAFDIQRHLNNEPVVARPPSNLYRFQKLVRRNKFLARRGRMREAAADYSRLIQFEPEKIEHYFKLAPLMLVNGDVAGYRHVCELVLARFGATKNDPGAADRAAKTCCLLPPAESDLAQIGRLAEVAITAEQTDTVDSRPWQHLTKGLAEYRQGNYQAAVDWMHKTLSQPLRFGDDSRYLSAWMILVMAHYPLVQMDDARAAFAQGVELAQTKVPDLGSDDLDNEWQNPLIARILMREAKALIERSSETTPETK